MQARFLNLEHSAKNHREFAEAQKNHPVGLYARPMG